MEKLPDLPNTSDEANLRMEYEKTQEMAMHYDSMNWTIGSILIAGIFLTIGIVGDRTQLYPHIAVLSFLVLLAWRLYYKRHKDIQKIKFARLHEIEWILGLQQHLLVDREDKARSMKFIKGDHIANLLTLGIPILLLAIAYYRSLVDFFCSHPF